MRSLSSRIKYTPGTAGISLRRLSRRSESLTNGRVFVDGIASYLSKIETDCTLFYFTLIVLIFTAATVAKPTDYTLKSVIISEIKTCGCVLPSDSEKTLPASLLQLKRRHPSIQCDRQLRVQTRLRESPPPL